jgi:hypothetical protein
MRLVSRATYRARQFFAALRPRVRETEREQALVFLGTGLAPLFESMGATDQRHCLDVYQELRRQGCGDRNVLTAALLHDAGKGRLAGAEVRLWHRVTYVVLAAVARGALEALSREGGLRTLREHACRGAELAERMGAPREVAEMIRRMEEASGGDSRLRALQAADDSC